MPSIFIPADAKTEALVELAVKNWHPDLLKTETKIGTLLVLAGSENQPALKENGHQVDGTIKIVAPKDRVSKKFDVEMLIDGDEWRNDDQATRLAKVDHLLSRLEIRRRKPKKNKKKHRDNPAAAHGTNAEQQAHSETEFQVDGEGRPRLCIRKGDWNAGYGFRTVVARHGKLAPEARNAARASVIVEEEMKNFQLRELETEKLSAADAQVAATPQVPVDTAVVLTAG